MKTFPMFLTMTNRRVVIVGGGEQAAQKCRLILKTEARIEVLAQTLDSELQDLSERGRIFWSDEAIKPAHFVDTALVFVATGCPGLDAAIYDLAKCAGAVVNVVDRPDLCDAITPSIVDRDPVVVAIGTEGTAPVLGRQIKTKIENMLEPRLGDLAALAGRLRGFAAERLGPRQRRDLWKWVFNGPIRAQHASGAEMHAARALKDAIASGNFADAAPKPVALVGAGPGSSDLITLRGVQRMQEADVIYYDRLVDPQVLELARRDAERVFVGKSPGCHHWPQEKINQTLVSAAKRGKRVVRLKCGDPGIFARGAEEAAALREAGIDYEVVPGVTAASGAAAAADGFLTERGKTDTLVLTSGTSAEPGRTPDWLRMLHHRSRVVVYMGVGAASNIETALRSAGIADQVKVQVVANAQRADQNIFTCKASGLAESLQQAGVENTAILVLETAVGEDCRLEFREAV